MCFSATASFAVSGVLSGIGVAAQAKCPTARHRLFAAIPLLFAVQQAAEGVVWSTVMPVALWFIERDPARRRVLLAFSGAGVLDSGFGALLLAGGQITSRIAGHCIRYEFGMSHPVIGSDPYLAGYVVVTIAPFFASRTSLARAIGTALLVSLALTVFMNRVTLTSVWCFFAAIVSGLVLVSVVRES